MEVLIRVGRPGAGIEAAEESLLASEEEQRLDPGNVRIESLRLHLLYDLGWAYQARAESTLAAGGAPTDDLEAARFAMEDALALYRELDRAGRLHAAEKQSDRIRERLVRIDELFASVRGEQ